MVGKFMLKQWGLPRTMGSVFWWSWAWVIVLVLCVGLFGQGFVLCVGLWGLLLVSFQLLTLGGLRGTMLFGCFSSHLFSTPKSGGLRGELIIIVAYGA